MEKLANKFIDNHIEPSAIKVEFGYGITSIRRENIAKLCIDGDIVDKSLRLKLFGRIFKIR